MPADDLQRKRTQAEERLRQTMVSALLGDGVSKKLGGATHEKLVRASQNRAALRQEFAAYRVLRNLTACVVHYARLEEHGPVSVEVFTRDRVQRQVLEEAAQSAAIPVEEMWRRFVAAVEEAKSEGGWDDGAKRRASVFRHLGGQERNWPEAWRPAESEYHTLSNEMRPLQRLASGVADYVRLEEGGPVTFDVYTRPRGRRLTIERAAESAGISVEEMWCRFVAAVEEAKRERGWDEWPERWATQLSALDEAFPGTTSRRVRHRARLITSGSGVRRQGGRLMDRDYVKARFGDQIDFGACFIGRNLNLNVLRGFARLDKLACVSAPDVYDQVSNPNGTQRALNEAHARDCRTYAVEAEGMPAEESPRFFPEILLNARDTNVVELYNVEDPTELYDFDSFSDADEVPGTLVGLRVDLTAVEFPKQSKSPQISRVDGNHRLWGIDELLGTAATNGDSANDDELPGVAFSLLIGLNANQEASLFRDINGEHKGMDVTHLAAIQVRISDPEELKHNPKWLPLWIADQLAQPGRAFDNMVFYGGEKAGLKSLGESRPVKLNSLKGTIATQLKSAEKVSAFLGDDPESLLGVLDNFWKAVRVTFPEAWDDKQGYILLQSIGLGAFAKFGGSIIDSAFEAEAVTEEDFKKHLAPVHDKVSLKREDYPGIAGAGGALVIADLLLKASEPDLVKAAKIKDMFKKSESIDEVLGVDGEAAADSSEAPVTE